MKVIRGITPTKPKLMIYGLSGCGKSTLAAKMEKPIFLDLEGGLNYIDVARTPLITRLEDFYADLVELTKQEPGKREFETIVIDSVDWLVRKLIEQVSGISTAKTFAQMDKMMELTLNRAGGGYGQGKQMLENHVRSKLLPLLMMLNDKFNYGIVLIAHAERKELLDVDGTNIEQIAPKIDTNTMNVFVEWCDNVFYLKRQGDARTLLVESDGVALAKNRLGLSGELDANTLDWKEVLTPKPAVAPIKKGQ